MKKLNTVSFALTAAVAMIASIAMIAPAFAQTSAIVSAGNGQDGPSHATWRGGGGMQPGIFGTVSSISGTTLTVTVAARPIRPTPESAGQPTALTTGGIVVTTNYSVDASNAKIYKGTSITAVSITSIALGDKVMVQGTVSGTNVVATVIRDGVGGMMGRLGMGGKGFGYGASSTTSSTPPIQGNGEPIVGGSVTAISGTTITVTNKSNVTYTIDASSATIVIKGVSGALSSVTVGDTVIVQGTVNGTSVTASSVIDQGTAGGSTSTGGLTEQHGGGFVGDMKGIFGSIGGFFQHLFGF
jgi:hypothetical protein